MAYKTFCDICKKEIKVGGIHVRLHLDTGQFCETCWIDKKNWPKIHKVIKEND
ncbi:MAG: hypothetical protein AAB535_01800 [Patescibacteria group bacterium]